MTATPEPGHRGGLRDWVAIILAVGLATALNVIVAAVLYDAIFSEGPGLSENATQILTGWGGGIIGIVGSYLGFRAGEHAQSAQTPERPAD